MAKSCRCSTPHPALRANLSPREKEKAVCAVFLLPWGEGGASAPDEGLHRIGEPTTLMTTRIKFAQAMRRHPTDAEAKLWSRLRRRQLDGLKFRRQVPIANRIVDFVCRDAKLVVEVDGRRHAESMIKDAERTRELEAAGFVVLRFWNHDVLLRTDTVVATILDHVVAARRNVPS